jgi:hypothetical protein
MFAEQLIKSRATYATPAGTIRVVSELQYNALSQVLSHANSIKELKDVLKTNPWDPITYSNPENFQPKRIAKELSSIGASSLFRLIIKKPLEF